jgi:hypothetical protein
MSVPQSSAVEQVMFDPLKRRSSLRADLDQRARTPD